MIRNVLRGAALMAAVALGACEKQLTITNPNSPNGQQALSSPEDLESFLGSYYLRWHSGIHGSQSNMGGMAAVQSFETFATLSNNCIGQRVGIPRAGNDNSIGNLCAPEQRRVYEYENEVQRVASSALKQLNSPGYTLGDAAQDARGKAFAQFLRGLALGTLSVTYDSTAIVNESMGDLEAGELRGYQEVNDSALAAFQMALDYTDESVAAGDGFPLPATWIPSSTNFSAAEFKKLIHSYAARYRAGVARTPEERAAVDWDKVIADAQAGITEDHDNITSTTGGPGDSWRQAFDGPGNYQTQPPWIIGMGDVSGSYAAWTALAVAARGPTFHMVTPDLRLPQGNTRAEQQADFAISSCSTAATKCKRYIANRASNADQTAQIPWGGSEYDFNRFHSWRLAGDDGTARNGSLVFFTLAELNLLEAEGHIRKGEFEQAAALINKTRVGNGGLPPITAFDGTSPVPGGDTNCVPKVPVDVQGPLKCGNMMEALKWEKRLETENTHWMAWFIDSRGWGDLPEGTPLYWATPFSDLQVRGKAVYSVGGSNPVGGAAKGTYGW